MSLMGIHFYLRSPPVLALESDAHSFLSTLGIPPPYPDSIDVLLLLFILLLLFFDFGESREFKLRKKILRRREVKKRRKERGKEKKEKEALSSLSLLNLSPPGGPGGGRGVHDTRDLFSVHPPKSHSPQTRTSTRFG
jgi:hypothetical protein